MSKFTVAGVSTLNGKVKLRFANDLALRIKVLERNGHSDVRLVQLPEELSKWAAANFLAQDAGFADVKTVIDAYVEKHK